ncbi:MAG: beta-galactosidase [Candidatus Omnitrophota bacterium]
MKHRRWFLVRLVLLAVIGLGWGVLAFPSSPVPLTGFSIHFDFIDGPESAERLLAFAYQHGAEVLNVIPPPHVWENPPDLRILKTIFAFANKHQLKIILTRIDASRVNGEQATRDNYMYSSILTERGVLPSGKPTPRYFCRTVGNRQFMQWQKEETLYYARHFSGEPSLIGFSIGMFNEPFVSQRGSLLCFDEDTKVYEIAQYTPDALNWWHDWLKTEFSHGVREVNRRYQTSFANVTDIPLPLNETDSRFGNPFLAYWDFVRSLNYWVVSQYEACRNIWHHHRKKEIPFILQFSGFEPEKLEKGRPAFAALDIFDWMKRADALGLSLYTNAEYPDRGHDSDQACVHFLQLGHLLNKPVYLLESGYEDNGAVSDADELNFFVSRSRELRPKTCIYEFLKMSYDETFTHNSGKLIDNSWNVNRQAVDRLNDALKRVKQAFEPSEKSLASRYIYDDPAAIRDSAHELTMRKAMIRRAYQEPVIFIPGNALTHLPAGSGLVVPRPAQTGKLLRYLKSRHIQVVDSETFLAENPKTPTTEK